MESDPAVRAALDRIEEKRQDAERRADPTIAAALVRIAEEEKAEERRAEAAKEAQRLEARKDLEARKHSELTIFMSHGGSPEEFQKAWPEILNRIMAEKRAARDAQTVNVFG